MTNTALQLELLAPADVPSPSPAERQGFRDEVMNVQNLVAQFPQVDCPLNHHFAPGAYAREILLPAGSFVIGKIHKHAHINVISKGRVTVLTEAGRVDMQAPYTFVSDPGTKRCVYAWEDTVWTTVHVTEETDMERLEAEIIAPTYEDYQKLEQARTAALEVNKE